MEAVKRSAMVGVQFTQSADRGYSYAVYLDGNRNGGTHSRHSERDRPADRGHRTFSDQFPGVEFGAVPGSPPVDPGGTPPGSDPIRLGSGNIASFSAVGTATSGTIYIRGRHDVQVRGLYLRRNRQDAHVETRFANAEMETRMKDTSPDRRGARRLDAFEEHRIVSACVRPGHRARLIDVSSRGALIETNHRLLPARTSNSTSRTQPIARAFEDVSSGAPWSGCVRHGSAIAAPLRSIAICRGSLTNAGKLLPRR